jgi:adenylate kinase
MDRGDLVSDEIVNELIAEKLDAHAGAPGFIFDGFPRTLAQGQALDALLAARGSKINLVIRLVADPEALVERVTKRYEEEGRADDNPEIYKTRLKAYLDQTAPLVPYYQAKGLLADVDGMKGIDEVTAAVAAVLDRPKSPKRGRGKR